MSSEGDLMIKKNARWAKIFGALTVVLLTMVIWTSYNENTLCPEVIIFLAVLGLCGGALSFIGTVIMIFLATVDDC